MAIYGKFANMLLDSQQAITEDNNDFSKEDKRQAKLDFNKFKSAWNFKTPAVFIKYEEDDDQICFGEYDVHDYPAFKKLKPDASREELIQVVNKDFYDKFDRAIEKVNKVIKGSIEIDGDWDGGSILYKVSKED